MSRQNDCTAGDSKCIRKCLHLSNIIKKSLLLKETEKSGQTQLMKKLCDLMAPKGQHKYSSALTLPPHRTEWQGHHP